MCWFVLNFEEVLEFINYRGHVSALYWINLSLDINQGELVC